MKNPIVYYNESDIFGLNIDQEEKLIKLIKTVQHDTIKDTVKFINQSINKIEQELKHKSKI